MVGCRMAAGYSILEPCVPVRSLLTLAPDHRLACRPKLRSCSGCDERAHRPRRMRGVDVVSEHLLELARLSTAHTAKPSSRPMPCVSSMDASSASICAGRVIQLACTGGCIAAPHETRRVGRLLRHANVELASPLALTAPGVLFRRTWSIWRQIDTRRTRTRESPRCTRSTCATTSLLIDPYLPHRTSALCVLLHAAYAHVLRKAARRGPRRTLQPPLIAPVHSCSLIPRHGSARGGSTSECTAAGSCSAYLTSGRPASPDRIPVTHGLSHPTGELAGLRWVTVLRAVRATTDAYLPRRSWTQKSELLSHICAGTVTRTGAPPGAL